VQFFLYSLQAAYPTSLASPTFFNFDEILINFVLQNANISPEISKILKFFVLGVFTLIIFFVYLIFLIKFKAFHKEDVEILAGGMRRAKIPAQWISFAEKFYYTES